MSHDVSTNNNSVLSAPSAPVASSTSLVVETRDIELRAIRVAPAPTAATADTSPVFKSVDDTTLFHKMDVDRTEQLDDATAKKLVLLKTKVEAVPLDNVVVAIVPVSASEQHIVDSRRELQDRDEARATERRLHEQETIERLEKIEREKKEARQRDHENQKQPEHEQSARSATDADNADTATTDPSDHTGAVPRKTAGATVAKAMRRETQEAAAADEAVVWLVQATGDDLEALALEMAEPAGPTDEPALAQAAAAMLPEAMPDDALPAAPSSAPANQRTTNSLELNAGNDNEPPPAAFNTSSEDESTGSGASSGINAGQAVLAVALGKPLSRLSPEPAGSLSGGGTASRPASNSSSAAQRERERRKRKTGGRHPAHATSQGQSQSDDRPHEAPLHPSASATVEFVSHRGNGRAAMSLLGTVPSIVGLRHDAALERANDQARAADRLALDLLAEDAASQAEAWSLGETIVVGTALAAAAHGAVRQLRRHRAAADHRPVILYAGTTRTEVPGSTDPASRHQPHVAEAAAASTTASRTAHGSTQHDASLQPQRALL